MDEDEKKLNEELSSQEVFEDLDEKELEPEVINEEEDNKEDE